MISFSESVVFKFQEHDFLSHFESKAYGIIGVINTL